MSKQKYELNDFLEKDSIESYLDTYLKILSSLLPDKCKLQPKERRFLVLAVIYELEGGNSSNFTEFHNFMVDKKFCKNRKTVSTYKQRMAEKKWAKTGAYKFELVPTLKFKKGQDLFYSVGIYYKNK